MICDYGDDVAVSVVVFVYLRVSHVYDPGKAWQDDGDERRPTRRPSAVLVDSSLRR